MKPSTPAELVCVAVALAGPNASDDQIASEFARASFLVMRAEEWFHNATEHQQAYILKLAEKADADDPVLPWSSQVLQQISGYDKKWPKANDEERGRKLWDSLDQAFKRTFGAVKVKILREKFRSGMEESRFRELWPQLSKWRRGRSGTLG